MRNTENNVYNKVKSEYKAPLKEVLPEASWPRKWWLALEASLVSTPPFLPK